MWYVRRRAHQSARWQVLASVLRVGPFGVYDPRTVHDRLSLSEGLQHFKLGFHQPGDEGRKFGMIVGQ
jgi:hypothetical protein